MPIDDSPKLAKPPSDRPRRPEDSVPGPPAWGSLVRCRVCGHEQTASPSSSGPWAGELRFCARCGGVVESPAPDSGSHVRPHLAPPVSPGPDASSFAPPSAGFGLRPPSNPGSMIAHAGFSPAPDRSPGTPGAPPGAATGFGPGFSPSPDRPPSSAGEVPLGSGSGSHPSLRPVSSVPDVIGRYHILSELGRGGMGVVYRCFDPALERQIAVKMIVDAAGLGIEQEDVDRFVREARVAAKLAHPNIVKVYEVGLHAGRPFLVMDMIEGESFEALLDRETVPHARLAEIVRDIALALQHAHGEGVLHRDVKPQNILIGRDGIPYLTDFGLARDVGSWKKLTMTGDVLGTPSYMSPEQAAGRNDEVGPRTDLWALGAVLYRALVGRPPHDGATAMVVIQKAVAEEPEPPRRLDPTISADLETIVLRSLEKEPRLRYRSTAELAAELQRFIEGEPILARPIGAIERLLRWARRNRVATGAFAALGLAVVAIAVVAAVAASRENRLRAERDAAAELARDRILVDARDAAGAALSAFEDARRQATDRPEAGDGLLALGLEALEATGRRLTLEPADETARRARFRAAMALGEVARDDEQWGVAAGAFEKASSLGVDDRLARAADAELGAARSFAREQRRTIVRTLLEETVSGAIGRRPGGYEDALFTLVGLAGADTAAALGESLDAVSADARESAAELYLRASRPTDDEARSGVTEIPGLADAVARWRALDPVGALDPADEAALAAAGERLAMRDVRMRPPGSLDARDLDGRAVVAAHQARAVGRSRLLLARLCCEALGRIGGPSSVEPIGRYLAAEVDPLRAVVPAEALCRLGGPRAERILLVARARFGPEGAFWTRVRRCLALTGVASELRVDSAEGYLERGTLRLEKGELQGAVADLTSAVKRDPGLAKAWADRGRARLRLRERPAAIADLERAVSLDPGDARAWRDLGHVRLLERLVDGAIADLDRAIELDPALATAWAIRASARIERDDRVRAVEDASRAIGLAPNLAIGWRTRARARFADGELELAVGDANRAVELDPGDAEGLNIRATVRAALGDFEGAYRDVDRAVDLAPDSASVWNGRGLVHARAGDLRLAITDFRRSLELDPSNAPVIHNLGNALRLLGQMDAALVEANRAVAVDPKYTGAYTLRGMIRRAQRRFDEAIADATRAIELDPGDAQSWSNRGNARREKGDLAGAVEDYGAAIERAPDLSVAWNNRGNAFAELGRLDEAIADFTRAVELDADNVQAWRNRALARKRSGSVAGALEDLSAAIEVDARYVPAFLTRASIHAEQGRLEDAVADYDRAVAISPRSGHAVVERGRLLIRLGRLDEGIADLERGLELVPASNPAHAQIRAQLDGARRRRGS